MRSEELVSVDLRRGAPSTSVEAKASTTITSTAGIPTMADSRRELSLTWSPALQSSQSLDTLNLVKGDDERVVRDESGNRQLQQHIDADDRDHPPQHLHADGIDAHSSHHHHHHDNEQHHHQEVVVVPFYAPPRQRQRWGDPQVIPHTNWGDVFFDLFYVAAAYNLGNVLADDPTPTGVLYMSGLFLPILYLWLHKTYYDGRFYYQDDFYHRGYEIALLLALSTAVLHIRPVPIMARPSQYIDMFLFGLGLSVADMLALGRLCEVMICQRYIKSQTGLYPEAYHAALHDIQKAVFTCMCFLAATVYAGWQYFVSKAGYDASATGSESLGETTTDSPGNDAHRFRSLGAADEAEKERFDHVAVALLLAGVTLSLIAYIASVIIFTMSKHGHKGWTVPINMDFCIHRNGEWVMLMLGESVLSLLIVDLVDTSGYIQTFLCGIISIVLLQYVHFHSAPSDPDQHAIRRSLFSGFSFYWLFQVYSVALIVLGVSYKMLLKEAVYMADGYNRRNLLSQVAWNYRRLASASVTTASGLSTMQRQQHVAHLFSGSMSLIFFCLDATSLSHRGIKVQLDRCKLADTPFKKGLLALLLVCRFLLILFAATLSQYETDPDMVATYGTIAIVVQVIVRLAGGYIFVNSEESELIAMERAIHFLASRIHERPTCSNHNEHSTEC